MAAAGGGGGEPLTMQTLIQRGCLKHRLMVPSDKGETFLGPIIDDATGLPSSSIGTTVKVYDFEKNLHMVETLGGCFSFYSYAKPGEDFRAQFKGWVDYLKARQKAAKVVLDKHGTVGYLWPHHSVALADGTPGVPCYYKPPAAGAVGSPSSVQSSGSGGQSSSVVGQKRPAPPDSADQPAATNGSSLKRPRTRFQYVPAEPRRAGPSEEEDGGFDPSQSLGEGAAQEQQQQLPHPSQFPRSSNPRFAYVPPTPPPGVEPPPGYHDPPAAASSSSSAWSVLDYESMLPADVVAKELAALGGLIAVAGGGGGGSRPGSSLGGASSGKHGWGRGGQKKAGEVASGQDQKTAASFYDQLNRDKGSRQQSLILHLRKLNNWVKAQLISEARPASGEDGADVEVLDLACGKGGDFQKYESLSRHYRIGRYVGIDIARASLDDAIGRYSKSVNVQRALGLSVTLACADLGSTDLTQDEIEVWTAADKDWSHETLLGEDEAFDLVSMQFALHYMFETEARARRFLSLVSSHLKPGGAFIATTVDARVVVELLASRASTESDGSVVMKLEDEKQRTLLRIQVDGETYGRIFRPSLDDAAPEAGLRYWFKLSEGGDEEGGASSDAVNAPEWLIPLPYLVRLAGDVGLELEYARNFHEFIEERRHEDGGGGSRQQRGGGGLGSSYRWVNYRGTISDAEWELARIYIALKFRKKGGPPPREDGGGRGGGGGGGGGKKPARKR